MLLDLIFSSFLVLSLVVCNLVFFFISCVWSPVMFLMVAFSFSNIFFDKLALIMYLPFVHTAHGYYQMNILVRYLDSILAVFLKPGL